MIEPSEFRRMLAHYPTGVCVVTSIQPDGTPIGVSLGSFTSVSLDPPLVGFLPAKASTTWPLIAAGRRFCVNVLGADQAAICRTFSSSTSDRFEGLDYRRGRNGAPVLAGGVLAIECDLYGTADAGDHLFVTGLVTGWEQSDNLPPLIFHRGDYRQLAVLDGR